MVTGSLRLASILVLGLSIPAADTTPPKPQQPREIVQVTNVVVPVRVFQRGKTVNGLTRSDFLVYENEVLQELTGCYLRQRHILPPPDPAPESDTRLPSRVFVLIFQVSNHNEALDRGVEFMVNEMFWRQDQLLVFVNDRTLFFNRLDDKIRVSRSIQELLKSQGTQARHRVIATIEEVQRQLDRLRNQMVYRENADATGYKLPLKIALENYLRILREFKRDHLFPDVQRYRTFSDYLRGIHREKWVISVYQTVVFPQFSQRLRQWISQTIQQLLGEGSTDAVFASLLSRLMKTIDLELKSSQNFPIDELKHHFSRIQATHHTVLIPPDSETLSEQFEARGISTDIEQVFRDITRQTGGRLVASAHLENAFREISQAEDVYYLISFKPEFEQPQGPLRIRTKDPTYEAVYDPFVRTGVPTSLDPGDTGGPGDRVTIRDLKYTENAFGLEIANFSKRMEEGVPCGLLNVRIRVHGAAGQTVYDQNRNLHVFKDPLTISIALPRLEAAPYDLWVEVLDVLNGRSTLKYLHVDLRPRPPAAG